MNSLRKDTIKVSDLDVNYYMAGQGNPLVVIHGGATGAESWIHNMAQLAESYTVYLPDLPGFGRSQPISGELRIPQLVDFVDRFSEKVGLKTFHLMGHSLGGGIALNYALKFPSKVKKLVLVSSMCLGKEIALWVRFFSSSAFVHSVGELVVGVLAGVKWIADRLWAGIDFVPPLSRASILIGSNMTTIRGQTLVLEGRLAEVEAPTLVVWGARDRVVPATQAYAAAGLIPRCQVEVFEGCGHSVYREKAHEFSKLLRDFLG